jgi:hypothetical protein
MAVCKVAQSRQEGKERVEERELVDKNGDSEELRDENLKDDQI